MDFASVFLQKRPFLLLLHSFGFLFPLEVAQALPHPLGQSDGCAAAPGLPSADQAVTEVTVKEATGAADSHRD